MKGILLAMLAFWPTLAFAQVRVEVRPEKPSFLEGEPIYVVADITNIGEYPIGYGAVGHDLTLSVDNVPPYQWRVACGFSMAPPPMPAAQMPVDGHLNTFPTGRTVSSRYLLRGYRLTPGTHQVRISGRAPVRWFAGGGGFLVPGAPPPPVIPHQPGDPVEGWDINRTVPIVVERATPEQLRPILEAARGRSIGGSQGSDELNVMYQMSPSLLAATAAEMAAKRETFWYVSYESLADHNTAETRAHLRQLYDTNKDLWDRASIARALHRTANIDNIDFFASLLPGRSTTADDGIRWTALRALDCLRVTGDRIATAMAPLLEGPNPGLQSEALRLLGRTGSRVAVTAIVAGALRDEQIFLGACQPLRTLTHYTWCDESVESIEALLAQPKRWPRWWARNQARVRIYGPDQEPPEGAKLPVVR